jgi:peptidoglycan/xylan/chitin deacetylase (PgdA/CDA1 family)
MSVVMNPTYKRLGLSLLETGGALALGRWLSRAALVTISYHRVLPGTLADYRWRPANSVFRDQLELHLGYLATNYHFVTAEEFDGFLQGQVLPEHSILVTFDDGYENNYTQAFPLLRSYRGSAFFFLSTDLIGQPEAALWFDRLDAILAVSSFQDVAKWFDSAGLLGQPASRGSLRQWLKRQSPHKRESVIHELEQRFGCDKAVLSDRSICGLMTWDQAKSLAEGGMAIGSHTASHQILSACPIEEARIEIEGSRARIEQELGRPCRYFSYPNGEPGDFRKDDMLALRRAGYCCAFTQIPGFVSSPFNSFALPRTSVPDFADLRVFKTYVSGVWSFAKRLARQHPCQVSRS